MLRTIGVKSLIFKLRSNKKFYILTAVALTSWVVPKDILKRTLPIPNLKRDGELNKIIPEDKRLKNTEVNIATNYGFKMASTLMDKGDHEFEAKIIIDNLGNKKYRYRAKKGDAPKTKKQIEENAEKDIKKINRTREQIKNLLRALRDAGVTVAIADPGKTGAAAVWQPGLQTIKIEKSKMEQGSMAVLRVLNHEAIHVAQSCKNGGINYKPVPLGIKLSPEQIYNKQINSKIYRNIPLQIKNAEKEAYSYEYSNLSVIHFLNKYC